MFTHKTTRLSLIYTEDWRPPPQTVANRFAGGNFALSSVRVVYILIKISNRRPTSEESSHCIVCVVFYITVFFFFFYFVYFFLFVFVCVVAWAIACILYTAVVAYATNTLTIVYSGVTDQVIVRPRNVTGFQQVIVFPGSSLLVFPATVTPGPILFYPYYNII